MVSTLVWDVSEEIVLIIIILKNTLAVYSVIVQNYFLTIAMLSDMAQDDSKD